MDTCAECSVGVQNDSYPKYVANLRRRLFFNHVYYVANLVRIPHVCSESNTFCFKQNLQIGGVSAMMNSVLWSIFIIAKHSYMFKFDLVIY